jgi:hypothetical protein
VFDIADYTATAHRVRIDDVDFDAFGDRPLSDSAVHCLRYMSDVGHTICYLRDLLVTPSHKDPAVTAFLTMWAEEFWHGEALDEVLRAHHVNADYGHIHRVRLAQGLRDRVAPIQQSIAANIIGDDFVAVHMSWGAINEWSAHSAYARLIERENHPELTKLLRRIQKQESRHLAFYNSHARKRLERSKRARRLTRFALRTFWAPVGSTIQPKAETRFVLDYLMGGDDGMRHIGVLDRKVDTLPGQEGPDLVSTAVSRFGVGPKAARPPSRPRGWRTTESVRVAVS